MKFTIKKSSVPAWGYEITAPGFHNIAPSVDSAVAYLKNRYGYDVQYKIVPDTTGLTKLYGSYAQVYLKGSRRSINRAIYTDGEKYFANYGGQMIELRRSMHYMDHFVTVEAY